MKKEIRFDLENVRHLVLITENVASDVVLLESDSPRRHVSQLTDGDKTRTSCVKLNDTNSWLQVDTGEVRIINTINIIFTGAVLNF